MKLFVSLLFIASVLIGILALASLSVPVALVLLGVLGWVMFRKPKE